MASWIGIEDGNMRNLVTAKVGTKTLRRTVSAAACASAGVPLAEIMRDMRSAGLRAVFFGLERNSRISCDKFRGSE